MSSFQLVLLMPWHLCHPRAALAQVLSSNVATSLLRVSLPLSWPVIHKLALGASVFCLALGGTVASISFGSDPLSQGFPAHRLGTQPGWGRLYTKEPQEKLQVRVFAQIVPLALLLTPWSLIKSFSLSNTTTNHSRLHDTAFPDSATIYRCSHSM